MKIEPAFYYEIRGKKNDVLIHTPVLLEGDKKKKELMDLFIKVGENFGLDKDVLEEIL